MGAKIPPAPKGIGTRGRALWREVLTDYELAEHELALLREAVRTVDDLERLAAVVAAEGVTISTGRAHPALVEARQLRIALARLLAALRLPAGDDEQSEGRRPQRRVGVRGIYAIGGLA